MPSSEQDETAKVQANIDGRYLRTSLEFSLRDATGLSRRFPLHKSPTKIGPKGTRKVDIEIATGPIVYLTWLQGRLFFDRQDSGLLRHNGVEAERGEFKAGDTLELGQEVLELWETSQVIRATLECYSDPFYARIWPIEQPQTSIGRPGKRNNAVVLDHQTVSREHATLLCDASGPSIQCESGGLLIIDGEEVPQGQSSRLKDGDLVQFGELLFRFRLLKAPEPELAIPSKLQIQSFGQLRVSRAGIAIGEKSWRTQAMKWLLARLALEWGRPVASEVLLELFWPDLPPDRSKNNLNYTVSSLRQLLKSDDNDRADYLLRTNQSLQLNPEILGQHDVSQFQSLLSQANLSSERGRDERSWEALSAALQLYQGPYLDGCFMDWAVNHRTRLEREALDAGQKLLDYRFECQDLDGVLHCSSMLLRIDECCQIAYLARMRVHNQRGQFRDALSAYECCARILEEQLSVDPDPSLREQCEIAVKGMSL